MSGSLETTERRIGLALPGLLCRTSKTGRLGTRPITRHRTRHRWESQEEGPKGSGLVLEAPPVLQGRLEPSLPKPGSGGGQVGECRTGRPSSPGREPVVGVTGPKDQTRLG